jgi:hypothetical protein
MSIPQNPIEEIIHPPLIVPAVKQKERFIIAISKNLEEESLELLKEYGKVIQFENNIYNNIPIQTLDFDYFIIDLRRREDRHYLQQIDPIFLETIHVISICHFFEKEDEYHSDIGAENILSKLPDRQAFKDDFNRLLLLKKIKKPNALFSCVKGLFRVAKGDWK